MAIKLQQQLKHTQWIMSHEKINCHREHFHEVYNAEKWDLENVERGKNVEIWTKEFSNTEIWTWKFWKYW